MPLTSETEEDRATILSRLARLQESEELRDEYFDLLGDLWSPVADWWQGEGAPSVEASVAELRRSLARGAKWYEIMSSECSVLIQHLPDIIERNETGHPVVLVGCALFGKGLYLDLPGCTLVALGDPTRLAIFEYLTRGPAGVTDIAADFSLSQPTVSVHIKRLREAGLVSAVRRGNRLELSVESSTAAKLADDLGRLLTKAPASAEGWRAAPSG
jgi:DNA-binding transcriptional ArsR family regulator